MRVTFSPEPEQLIPENLGHFFSLVRVHSGQHEPLGEKAEIDQQREIIGSVFLKIPNFLKMDV